MAFGDSFLAELQGIDWNLLRAADAVELRNALKEAVARSDHWFEQLANGFSTRPGNPPPGKVSPPQGPVPQPASPSLGVKRGRGRPRGSTKNRGVPPLAVGGADAAAPPAPPAKLFQDSYVSHDGPRRDIPAALPPDHPRRSLLRESSVTPDIDAADFQEVEQFVNSGKSIKDIFQVR